MSSHHPKDSMFLNLLVLEEGGPIFFILPVILESYHHRKSHLHLHLLQAFLSLQGPSGARFQGSASWRKRTERRLRVHS